MNRNKTWTVDQLIAAVKNSYSYAEALRALNLRPTGGNYKQLKKYITTYDLDTSHMTGKGWCSGEKQARLALYNTIPLEEILVEHSYYKSARLRERLIEAGIKERKCEKCHLTEWLAKPISLELDHINGINTDNRIEYLCILCPNCHAQTPTYRGRNKKRPDVMELVYIEVLNTSGASHTGSNPVVGTYKYQSNICLDCDKKITSKPTRCKLCSKNYQDKLIDWPDAQKLVDKIVAGSSYSSLSRELGVSDNAIRKHIARSGLEVPRKYKHKN